MYLALRRGAATDAKWLDHFFIWVIKERLVTDFPHAGIVIGDQLYHATARHGFCKTPYTPERWELWPLGDERDAEVQAKADALIARGTGYDFAELFDFTPLKWVVKVARKVPVLRHWLDNLLYCYQWCWLALTGCYPTRRVTAEMLLALYAQRLLDRLERAGK
ncbi:hypothetical protein ACVC7V_17560 [Hydrogenophaga sp. A37]|uniref:hypothetical protein n=1 Tax=Hydrogenophaga sp. A37 TaxID=1945864 RepID=UPI0009842C39|nr:hypothetical protein [Hydrogenophaga sp. A37]OOG79160.1 hypothetical protein B0E41_25380 [Hydrogenophaga sp. A37]